MDSSRREWRRRFNLLLALVIRPLTTNRFADVHTRGGGYCIIAFMRYPCLTFGSVVAGGACVNATRGVGSDVKHDGFLQYLRPELLPLTVCLPFSEGALVVVNVSIRTCHHVDLRNSMLLQSVLAWCWFSKRSWFCGTGRRVVGCVFLPPCRVPRLLLLNQWWTLGSNFLYAMFHIPPCHTLGTCVLSCSRAGNY